MKQTETIDEFYQRVPQANAAGLSLTNAGAGHFNVFSRSACFQKTAYVRRDFYKVSLIIGSGTLYYANKWIQIDKPALLFSNPVIPYSWEVGSEKQEGWFCLFTESFVQHHERRETLSESPLFKIGGNPVFFINDRQLQETSTIFQKMMAEMASNYTYKYDLLRNYLHLLIHEAMKMRPAERFEKYTNASTRITSLFMELLERQFPIDTPENALRLKTAADYAQNLSLHVNSLNRSVKEVTGKTTTEHIAGRIIREAKALLQHTDWAIADIAYGLGFDEPAYFTTFFKKQTGQSPHSLRNSLV